MFRAFLNVFRVPDLRKKVLFTLLMLAVYRIGFYVPLPGVDQDKLSRHFQTAGGGGATEQAAAMFAMFTGGDLGQSTLFGLGIMPYISASIIFQLLVTVVPALEKLQKEGESGRRKIMEYTRYATVGLCFIQAVFWVRYLTGADLVHPEFQGTIAFAIVAITGLMAGTIILMWLGEQIDEYGIGNGISLIIMAGIVARLPYVLLEVWNGFTASLAGGTQAAVVLGPEKIVFLVISFVGVVAGSILITQAQRRIKIQQAKQTRGRRVVGGAQHYLPLRVNHGGVMPIIFASSFLLFPGVIFGWLSRSAMWPMGFWSFLAEVFQPGAFIYELTYVLMVYFFAYFWVSVQFQPKELANNLRDMGSFIPGSATRETHRRLPRIGHEPDHVRRRRLLGRDRDHPVRRCRLLRDPVPDLRVPGWHRPADRGQRYPRPHPARRGQPDHAELRGLPRRRPCERTPVLMPKNLLFLGPPGSGKGTQATRLCEKFDLVQLSSGDALRRERKEGSEIGRQAAKYMDEGTLVPDDVITGVMLAAIDKRPAGKGVILDGFPRTVPQAEALDRGLAERNLKIDAVVDFELDDAEIIRRIVERRVCGDCGATYNLSFLPPKEAGVCDKCGGRNIIQRPDDREEVVRTRLETYRAQTEPLIAYYAKRGVLTKVDASVGADGVEQRVAEVVAAAGPA
jgi:preprotein translocase subunit SecY